MFTRKLSETVGYQGPMLMLAWFTTSGFLMKYISPSFGKLTAIEQSRIDIVNNFKLWREILELSIQVLLITQKKSPFIKEINGNSLKSINPSMYSNK